MASADTIAFTTANFPSEVLASQEPVLVDFWAEWCGPCRAIAPTIDQLASEFKGRVKIGKLDIDSERDVAMNYGIQSIPTLLFFKGGQVVDKLVGVPNKAALVAKIEALAG
jgi:thioredoxin 1